MARVFKPTYEQLGYFSRAGPIIAFGFASILMQGIILSIIYPCMCRGLTATQGALTLAVVMGAYHWTTHVEFDVRFAATARIYLLATSGVNIMRMQLSSSPLLRSSPMRMVCNVLTCLFISTLGVCLAQDVDPFGGGAAADPFSNKQTKKTVVQGAQNQRVAQTKTIAQKGHRVKAGVSEKTLRIRAALDDETSQTFVESPLMDAVAQISETHDIPIVIDRRALEEVGLTPDTPVSLSLKNVTLRSFLRLMLREWDLTYIVSDEVMQITTIEAAEKCLALEMYRFPAELIDNSDKILKSLTLAVAPDVWNEKGGPCSVTTIENVLVVSAPGPIHDDVVEFLEKLTAAFEFPPSGH